MIGKRMQHAPAAQAEGSLRRTLASPATGRSLDPAARRPLESRFGHNFGSVRVHADGEADRLAAGLRARAFTTGQDIFFRAGAYDPDSPAGLRLLAHELTHTIQQGPLTGEPTVVQREEEKQGLHFDPLPPSLGYGFPALGGNADLSVGLGGPSLDWKRGLLHGGAESSWGGELGLNLGYGAPLMPWMMDVNRDLGEGQAGMNSILNGGGLTGPNLSNLGGFGVLGDIAGAGGPTHPWGVGLQGQYSPDEQRVMAGLRVNF